MVKRLPLAWFRTSPNARHLPGTKAAAHRQQKHHAARLPLSNRNWNWSPPMVTAASQALGAANQKQPAMKLQIDKAVPADKEVVTSLLKEADLLTDDLPAGL